MRKRQQGIKAFAFEEDLYAAGYLGQYGITLNPPTTPTVDLCISSHSLEHYTSPHAFFELIRKLSPRRLFIEVPNCDGLSNEFLKQPYHSPHLLFFSEQSLLRVAEDFGWRPIQIATTGWSLEDAVALMSLQQEYILRLEQFTYMGKTIRTMKSFMKILVKRLISSLIQSDPKPQGPEHDLYRYGGKRFCLRGLFAPLGDSLV